METINSAGKGWKPRRDRRGILPTPSALFPYQNWNGEQTSFNHGVGSTGVDLQGTVAEFPEHYSILVSGPPGVGKFEYFIDLARLWLSRGERVAFVTLDLSPKEIRERGQILGLDAANTGQPFLFIDCFSAQGAPPETQVRTLTVSSYSNLEGLSMAIQKAAQELGPPVRILFYTISTLFLHNSPQAIAKFFQIVTSRVKTTMGFVAYAVHDGVHETTTMNLLRSLSDGVIELRFTEQMGREMRPHHLRGLKVDTQWRPIPETNALVLTGVA